MTCGFAEVGPVAEGVTYRDWMEVAKPPSNPEVTPVCHLPRRRPASVHPTRHERLLEVLASVPDPRDRRGTRYPLAGLLALVVTATLAGARSFAVIGQWAAAATAEHLAAFGLGAVAAPDESTLRKLFARIDADALDSALAVWMWTRTVVAGQRRVIALDGKTVRGARHRADDTAAPHRVAAFDHGAGAVLRQVCVEAKSNEIPAARTLLSRLDLDGAVVTTDALHTQTDTATLITKAGGDYVFTVKANTPTLHRQLKAWLWKDIPATRATTTGRGRRITRTVKVAAVPTGSASPVWRRSRSCAGRSLAEGARPSRSSTWSPPPTTSRPRLWSSRPGCRDSGASRTVCTGFVMPRSAKISRRSAPDRHRGSWPPAATSRSACCASRVGTTSPPGYATTPDTPITPSHWP